MVGVGAGEVGGGVWERSQRSDEEHTRSNKSFFGVNKTFKLIIKQISHNKFLPNTLKGIGSNANYYNIIIFTRKYLF